MREECGVEQGDERRALSSCDHVGGTEVRDYGRMDGGGDERGLAKLPGAGDAAAGVALRDALVVDGLAVTADEVERVSLRGGLRGIAVGLAETPVETCKLGGRVFRRLVRQALLFAVLLRREMRDGAPARCGGRGRAAEMRQSATSMPSADVPLMMPATSIDFLFAGGGVTRLPAEFWPRPRR